MNYLHKFLNEKYFVLDLQLFNNTPIDDRMNVGDAIALSKIPELIKKDPNRLYKKVYIRRLKTLYETEPLFIEKLYANNPYIDGIIDHEYTSVFNGFLYFQNTIDNNKIYSKCNIIDLFSYFIGINPNIHTNTYYPTLNWETNNIPYLNNKTVLDITGNNQSKTMKLHKIQDYIQKNNIKLDYQIRLNFLDSSHYAVHENMMGWSLPDVPIININNSDEYVDTLMSSKNLYTILSGNTILLTALNKTFTSFVFPAISEREISIYHKRMYFHRVGTYVEFPDYD